MITTFKQIINEIQISLKDNNKNIINALQKNPALSYSMINKLCFDVSKRYNLNILLNFPEKEKINDFSSYGTQNISIIIDRTRKRFPISSELIKLQAKKMLSNSTINPYSPIPLNDSYRSRKYNASQMFGRKG